jgi:hypothetical protein
LATKASAILPSIISAQEVVMPQAGHLIPRAKTELHGGSPNCRWVPCPLGSGLSQAAIPRPHRSMAVRSAKPARSFRSS